MSEKDHLKKLIADHRGSFDRNIPDPQLWTKIQHQIQTGPKAEKPGKTYSIQRKTWVAAASILLLLSAGLYQIFYVTRPIEHVAGTESVIQQAEQSQKPVQPESLEQKPIKSVDMQIGGVEQPEPSSPQNLEPKIAQPTETRLSTSQRMEDILYLATLPELSAAQIEQLVHAINQDPSTNVRLAALEALWQRIPPQLSNELIQLVFIEQDDPSVQLELMMVMEYDDSLQLEPATSEKLNSIASDPLTLDFVKEQAYAVLMKNW